MSVSYFREDDHGAKFRCKLPDKASVVGEPRYVALVPAVEEDGALASGAPPVLDVDEVTLPERRQIGEAEVIETLLEVPGLISVLQTVSCQRGFDGAWKSAEEARDPFG